MKKMESHRDQVIRCAQSGDGLDTVTIGFVAAELRELSRWEILDDRGDGLFRDVFREYLSGLGIDVSGVDPIWVDLQAAAAAAAAGRDLAGPALEALRNYQLKSMEAPHEVRRVALHTILDAVQPLIGDVPRKSPYTRTLEVPM